MSQVVGSVSIWLDFLIFGNSHNQNLTISKTNLPNTKWTLLKWQKCFKVVKSGEISPNLVTLVVGPWFFQNNFTVDP